MLIYSGRELRKESVYIYRRGGNGNCLHMTSEKGRGSDYMWHQSGKQVCLHIAWERGPAYVWHGRGDLITCDIRDGKGSVYILCQRGKVTYDVGMGICLNMASGWEWISLHVTSERGLIYIWHETWGGIWLHVISEGGPACIYRRGDLLTYDVREGISSHMPSEGGRGTVHIWHQKGDLLTHDIREGKRSIYTICQRGQEIRLHMTSEWGSA